MKPFMLLRMSKVPSGKQRVAIRQARTATLAFVLLSFLLSSTSWAGTCNETRRVYRITGTATPLDWTWEIGHPLGGSNLPTVSTVLAATSGLLSNGDSAKKIAKLFVNDLKAHGYNANSLGGGRFRVRSCPLIINNLVVPMKPAKLMFNPEIELESSGPDVPSISQFGIIATVALLGAAGLYKSRRRSERSELLPQEGGEE